MRCVNIQFKLLDKNNIYAVIEKKYLEYSFVNSKYNYDSKFNSSH